LVTDCRSGGYAESAPRFGSGLCRAGRSTPSSVAAGGGVFIAHVVGKMFLGLAGYFLVMRAGARVWKMSGLVKRKTLLAS